MCCKKLANSQQSSSKIILLHYLRQIGGRLLLSCNFNVKKLPITLPKFYVECLLTFSEHSTSVREQILNLSNSFRTSTVIWNIRHILIYRKSVFYQSLFDKGIITLENLITDTNVLLVRQNPNRLPFMPLEWFQLIQIFQALPTQWRKSLNFNRILNRYLTTNSFLYKIGLANSPLCTFCKQESESLEHLLITCSCTKSFWSDFITWSHQLNIFLRDLSDSDILFGLWQRREDCLFINHMLVLAKQHIYECRNKCTYPSFTIFLIKVSYLDKLTSKLITVTVRQLEKKLMNSNNKVADHYSAVVVRIKMQK